MTRYLDVSTDIARQVESGELPSGAELPGIRGLAGERGTTPATVGRAYRALSDSGVIVVGDRRRARVAPDGVIAARRFLNGERVFRLAGSDDPALNIVLSNAGRQIRTVGTRGSFHGLTALTRGDADGAVIHLLHHCGIYNAPFARALLRGREPTIVHLWRREQGLIVPAGNPKGIKTAGDLATLRVARREAGAGTRVLLDRLLLEVGLTPEAVPGPQTTSHLEVALAVAAGIADAGLGLRSAARDLDLDFVALTWEHYDLVLGADALGDAAPLITALHDDTVRTSISELGGYDITHAGDVKPLDPHDNQTRIPHRAKGADRP